MKKFRTISASAIDVFITSDTVQSLVAKSDPNEPLFLVKMSPVRTLGPFEYSTSADKLVLVPCVVLQSRYRMSDNYKIEVAPTVPGFSNQSYYLSDFAQLLHSGDFFVIDQNAPEPSFVGWVYELATRFNLKAPRGQLSLKRWFGKLFGHSSLSRY